MLFVSRCTFACEKTDPLPIGFGRSDPSKPMWGRACPDVELLYGASSKKVQTLKRSAKSKPQLIRKGRRVQQLEFTPRDLLSNLACNYLTTMLTTNTLNAYLVV